jgi:hypothetical protein
VRNYEKYIVSMSHESKDGYQISLQT